MIETLVFRVRKIYFDDIVSGRKTAEVRRVSPYWTTMVENANETLRNNGSLIAMFFCGPKQHVRPIQSIERYETAREALGREPSEQGKKDIGEGPVYRFNLGENK